MNFLSLVDESPEEGAAGLREILELYTSGHPLAERQINGVLSVEAKPVTRRLAVPGPISFGRGLEIVITLEESAFEAGGMYLLGAVVSEFFASRWMPAAAADDILRRLRELGTETAVITLGSRGARALADGGFFDCPAFPVDAVDTTGAGDAFHGGYVAGLLDELDLPERMRFASATAALNCQALGGQQGLPTRAEVIALLG